MPEEPRPGRRSIAKFVLGCGLAVTLLAGLAEAYLRLFPPRDFYPYLGEASPLTGPFRPDDDFGAAYASWDAFAADNAERLQEHLPLAGHPDPRPVWAFFGNSFVQAPGMLGDTAKANVPDRRVFHLGRNELLFVRLAQVKLLLENGLKPERVFIELMPVDTVPLGRQPLSTVQVTSHGAITYRPRFPRGLVGSLVRHSQVGLAAWVRADRQVGNPRFRQRDLYDRIDPVLHDDLCRLFASLARVTREHDVPVTVILIPSYHQVLHGASYNFQDLLAAFLRPQGYDVFDPREAFHAQPDRAALYLPDKHLTPLGNRVLLAELLRHVRGDGAEGGQP